MALLSHWINKPRNGSTSEPLVKGDNKISLLFKRVDLDFLSSVAQTILIDTHGQVGSDSQSCVYVAPWSGWSDPVTPRRLKGE